MQAATIRLATGCTTPISAASPPTVISPGASATTFNTKLRDTSRLVAGVRRRNRDRAGPIWSSRASSAELLTSQIVVPHAFAYRM